MFFAVHSSSCAARCFWTRMVKMGSVLLKMPQELGMRTRPEHAVSLIPDRRLSAVRPAAMTGFVLAGGASRRMGRPKAELVIEGVTMLERQIRLLRSIARRVVVVGGYPGFLKESCVSGVPDIVAGRGPLAGIYTALLQTRTEFNLVLGCDLPSINRRLLAFLAGRAHAARSDVTVPLSREGRLQSLCAVYRRRALYAVGTTLAGGENKPRNFFPRVHCLAVPWSGLAGAEFRPSIFTNLNTPKDYEYARARIEASTAPLL